METTRWQGLGVEPPTFRSEAQRAYDYTTAPLQKREGDVVPLVTSAQYMFIYGVSGWGEFTNGLTAAVISFLIH